MFNTVSIARSFHRDSHSFVVMILVPFHEVGWKVLGSLTWDGSTTLSFPRSPPYLTDCEVVMKIRAISRDLVFVLFGSLR